LYKNQLTRNAAVVRKQTARYMPKAIAIHYLNVCHGDKNRWRSAKKQRLVPGICHSAIYERITAELISVREQETRI